ncbi:MAG TPA: proton-conducting transporter membrane subunit [Terracidiphilus sp.]|nr:proton-conducting transporter membrane subunit [Terracidiphilus sp.]
MSASWIILAPCSLLIGAVLELFAARLLPGRAKGILALLCSLPALAGALAALPAVQHGGALDYRLGPWDGPIALVFHIDALGVLFALMGAGLGAAILLYSIGYMARDRGATRFFATMLVFIAGFIGLVFSANLLFMYLCWEAIGLCSFSLVGFWYANPEAVNGARKVLLMTHLAGYGLLAAILIIFHSVGSLAWTDPAVAHAFTSGVFLLMAVSLVAKSVQIPLHTWIPDAMAAPTPVSALLHAACYVKAGVYLAARMYSFGALPGHCGAVLVWIGTTTMVLGVMYAMVQTDLKRMLAFHTVSQIGYMIVGLGIGTPLAIVAGLLHCLNHAFFKGGLFLSAGSVQHGTGTREMNELGGLAPCMPRTTLFWLVNAGGIMGIPLMSGFASKWLLYTAALQAGWVVPALAAWVTSLGTVFSFLKATSTVFLGPTTEKTEHAHESPFSMQAGMGIIAAGTLVLGIAPQVAVRFLLNPVLAAFGMVQGAQVTWFGMASATGSFLVGEGLVLALVSVVFGALIWMMATSVARPTAATAVVVGGGTGAFTGGEPLIGDGRLPADEFSGMLHDNWHAFFTWTNVDRVWIGAGQVLIALSAAVGRAVAWTERHAVLSLVAVSCVLVAWAHAFIFPAGPVTPAVIVAAPALLLAGCALALVALVAAALAQPIFRRHALLMALSGALAVAGLTVSDPEWRLALLELAAGAAALLVWRAVKTAGARSAYLAAFALSAASLISSEVLIARGEFDWARALFFTGILIKLAAVPLFFWLLRLADELPALVLGLLIAVVDIAVFGEPAIAAQASPWLLEPRGLWLTAAAISALGGSLFMLTQRDLKRLLVLSTVEDIGFLLLGVSAVAAFGFEGAVIGATVHALAKALLFTALSAPEAGGALDGGKGLASLYPVSGAAFLFGMLAMLGVPPLLGYAAHWRLYDTTLTYSPLVLALFAVSSGMALIAYVLALTRFWWGPPAVDAPPAPEPWLVRATLIVLIVVLLAAGLWPHALDLLHLGPADFFSAGLWRLP